MVRKYFDDIIEQAHNPKSPFFTSLQANAARKSMQTFKFNIQVQVQF